MTGGQDARADVAAWVRRTVAEAPPISADTAARIARILTSAASDRGRPAPWFDEGGAVEGRTLDGREIEDAPPL